MRLLTVYHHFVVDFDVRIWVIPKSACLGISAKTSILLQPPHLVQITQPFSLHWSSHPPAAFLTPKS